MKLNVSLRICSVPLAIMSTSLIAQTDDVTSKPSKFEKLGTAKVQEFQMTKEQQADADRKVAESFEQGFRNSSPEVQKAILKAAEDLEAKKKSESGK